jgi:hypothetical protein
MPNNVNLNEKLAGFADLWRPRGVEHQPYAAEETHLLLIEPVGTPNTGDPATAAPWQTA